MSQVTGGSRWQQIWLVFAVSPRVRFASDCDRLRPRGSIKAPSSGDDEQISGALRVLLPRLRVDDPVPLWREDPARGGWTLLASLVCGARRCCRNAAINQVDVRGEPLGPSCR